MSGLLPRMKNGGRPKTWANHFSEQIFSFVSSTFCSRSEFLMRGVIPLEANTSFLKEETRKSESVYSSE